MNTSSPKRVPRRQTNGMQSGLSVLTPGAPSSSVKPGGSKQKRSAKRSIGRGGVNVLGSGSEPPMGPSKEVSSKVPIDLSTEFLAAVMSKDFSKAKDLCEQILRFDPTYETAKQFLPVIKEKLELDAQSSESSSSSSDEEEDAMEQDSHGSQNVMERNNEHNQNDDESDGIDSDGGSDSDNVGGEVPRQYVGSGILLRNDDDSGEIRRSIQSHAKPAAIRRGISKISKINL